MKNMTGCLSWSRAALSGLLLCMMCGDVMAHGERAQLASMRMRTVHWFDLVVTPNKVKVGDIVTVTGKFAPSVWWPKHMPSIEDTAYLNIGVPGPTFIRLDASVNGVPMVRSTSFELGKVYDYKIVLRARIPGRYHVHSLLNVMDAGPLVGKGTWVEVEDAGTGLPFVNELTLLTGDTVDLETYGIDDFVPWTVLWIVMGIAYILYWLLRRELFIPRFLRIRELGPDRANEIMTQRDFTVGAIFFTLTLALILGGYLWAENKYPITIALQTGKVDVEGYPLPAGDLEINLDSASYKLTGRSLTMQTTMTNRGDQALHIGEFMTANIRFVNPEVIGSRFFEDEEMVAPAGLTVDNDVIEPGQTLEVTMVASDALWEQYRMTGLINDPDSRFAGMVFYYNDDGERFYQEVGGSILPDFF